MKTNKADSAKADKLDQRSAQSPFEQSDSKYG